MEDALPVSIRLNPFKRPAGTSAWEADAVCVPWSPWGRTLRERPVFTLDPLFHAGCYYVQDASAMFVGALFRSLLPTRPARPLRVLDLCAAPGGKTTDLAASLREAYGDAFLLVSNEVMRQRVRVLCDNVAVWGDPCVTVTSADPALFGRLLPGWFDCIVADVPCSGEGMFRKDARAREEWRPATVDFCAARQKRILSDVWPALKQGGILVYSTCTYE
ncbi:MAG: RsmB/NOP family class I SAM-dependent RNA methyltransferase, partial [Bacteroidales bacterium]|nr:RsmB/NOP family class I SAM-dependent RNA methyltransferase [Bacteroidales bacterium]